MEETLTSFLWVNVFQVEFFPIRSYTGTAFGGAAGTGFTVQVLQFTGDGCSRYNFVIPALLTACQDKYNNHSIEEAIELAVNAVLEGNLERTQDVAAVTVEAAEPFRMVTIEDEKCLLLENFKIRQGLRNRAEKLVVKEDRGVLVVWKTKAWTDPQRSWTEHFYVANNPSVPLPKNWIAKQVRPFNQPTFISADHEDLFEVSPKVLEYEP
jgi:hypothetical protein